MTDVLRLQADPETDGAQASPGAARYVSVLSIGLCKEA